MLLGLFVVEPLGVEFVMPESGLGAAVAGSVVAGVEEVASGPFVESAGAGLVLVDVSLVVVPGMGVLVSMVVVSGVDGAVLEGGGGFAVVGLAMSVSEAL